jgi:hypothetical protein
MPNINSIPEVLYLPNQPYHYYYDNLPLKNILTRIGLVNIQVDYNTDVLRGSAGSAGSLNNRLDASLEQDGSIKTSSVDSALHNIAYHSDGFDSNGTEYVRMKKEERNKLESISSEANNLSIEINDGSNLFTIPTESNETLKIRNSSTIEFNFQAPNILTAHSVYPPEFAHKHNYNITPAFDIPDGPTYRFFKTSAINTPFIEGTLKVYINGIRITNVPINVPNSDASSWSPTFIETQDHLNGTFDLNRSISDQDIIRIDFDQSFE